MTRKKSAPSQASSCNLLQHTHSWPRSYTMYPLLNNWAHCRQVFSESTRQASYTTPADAQSRQALYCTLCHKKGSHKAANCFKRPGHTVLAAWAQSTLNIPNTRPSTHEWAGMVTASVHNPPNTTSAGCNLLLHMDTTTSAPLSVLEVMS